MILETKAKELLGALHHLSRISRIGDVKGLLLECDNAANLYTYSNDIYGKVIIDGKIEETGSQLLPLIVIPYLSKLGDASIRLKIDTDNITIYHDKSEINLNQMSGDKKHFSKREISPNWIGTDLARLKNIRYASTDAYGFDTFWINNQSIIATDRIRVVVYKPINIPENINFAIPNFITSYLPDGIIDLSIGETIYLGSDKSNISITPKVDAAYPKQLDSLIEDDFNNCVSVNLQTLSRAVDVIAMMAKDNPGCRLELSDYLTLTSESSSGSAKQQINIFDSSNLSKPINIKLSAFALKQAVDNCLGPQVILGNKQINDKFSLLYLFDYDITHFIVPF